MTIWCSISIPARRCLPAAVRAARVVRQVLVDEGLDAVIKTSGAKGLHIFVPIDGGVSMEEAAAATRAIAARAEGLDPDTLTSAFMKDDREGKVFLDSTRVGGATVVAAYSPRVRPGAPVSFPLDWDELDDVPPADFTVLTAVSRLGDGDRWATRMPQPQRLGSECLRRADPSLSLASKPCMRASAERGEAGEPQSEFLDTSFVAGRRSSNCVRYTLHPGKRDILIDHLIGSSSRARRHSG